MKDLAVDREQNPEAAAKDTWDPTAEEEDDDDDDDLDVNIIDRSGFLESSVTLPYTHTDLYRQKVRTLGPVNT